MAAESGNGQPLQAIRRFMDRYPTRS